MISRIAFFAGLCSLAIAATALASDDTIFNPPIITAPDVNGFKKIPADDAINQWSFDFDTGAVVTNAGPGNASNWQNLYLAFAVDVRYARECFGTKTTVLCTLLHSGIQVSGNLAWNNDPANNAGSRFAVVLIPMEYITGTFNKEGLDLKNTNGALYASIGVRAEDVRDLGIAVENRVTSVISAAINYASPEQGLGPGLAFHWIGSVRLFGGAVSAQMGPTGWAAPAQGGLTVGVETQIGLALDLARGSISVTNTTRLDGDTGFGNYGASFITDALEVKYLHAVCRDAKEGGCNAPRKFAYGGGVRFEYESSSYNVGAGNQSQSVERLIFFAELARF